MQNIIARKSVRTFTGENLSGAHKNAILDYLANEENMIGLNKNKVRIELKETDGSIGGKIGTYGMIKNAPAFLIIITKNTKNHMLDCGYVFEKMVIFLQGLGLGTCWLAGTFTRKQLMIDADLKEDEIIPIISPVGYCAQKMPVKEKMVRKVANSDNRIDFDSLFFFNDFKTRIEDKKIRNLLEMVQIAPSASNKQPWRAVALSNGTVHFYIERNPKYAGVKLGFDVQWLDVGISIAHYVLVSGKTDAFVENPNIQMLSENSEYVISIK